MGEIKKFNFYGYEVRVCEDENGEPLFVGKDVCERLGYSNATDAMNRHCRGVVKRYPIVDTLGRQQEVRVLLESDVMRLICSSQLPDAVRFEKWVFEEVLPAIRKTGGYMVSRPDETPDEILSRALLLAKETMDRQAARLAEAETKIREQTKQIEEKTEALELAAPKVAFVETFATSKKGNILVRDFAGMVSKTLSVKGFGQSVMFSWLKDNGYMNKNRYPSQRATDMKLLEATEGFHVFNDGTTGLHHCTRITPKGQTYFFEKIKEQYDNAGRWW